MDREARSADFARRQRLWATDFEQARRRAGLTVEQIAQYCDISTRALGGYTSCRQSLNLQLLGVLAEAVGVSPLGWAQIFGLVDENLLRAGQERERLLARASQAEARLARLGGTAEICQAALASTRWRVRFEPLFEGPPNCRLRTGDLCVIGRVDGGPCRATEIRDDLELGAALDAVGAVRQPGAVFVAGHEGGADPERDLRSEWVWMVPTLNIARVPDRWPRPCDARSIMIVSTHTGSWATDVATLVGLSLGFGTSTTTAMSRHLLGEKIRDDLSKNTGGTPTEIRARIAAEFLDGHTRDALPLVWAHAITTLEGPLLGQLGQVSDDTLIVYLRLTDREHDYLGHRVRTNNDRAVLEERREVLDNTLDPNSTAVLRLDAGFPDDLDPAAPLSRSTRDALLERAILHSLRVLGWLHTEHAGPALTDLQDQAPEPFRKLAGQLAPLLNGKPASEGLTAGRTYS